MGNTFQITVDAASPRLLGEFWCRVLGYIEQPVPDGFDNWDAALDAMGIGRARLPNPRGLADPYVNSGRPVRDGFVVRRGRVQPG